METAELRLGIYTAISRKTGQNADLSPLHLLDLHTVPALQNSVTDKSSLATGQAHRVALFSDAVRVRLSIHGPNHDYWSARQKSDHCPVACGLPLSAMDGFHGFYEAGADRHNFLRFFPLQRSTRGKPPNQNYGNPRFQLCLPLQRGLNASKKRQ